MIDQFAKDVFSNIQAQAENFKEATTGSESQLRAMLESAMRKLNLVSREEFDAQQAVLLRTREKLEALEKQVAALVDAQKAD